jgi:hypothetical protein
MFTTDEREESRCHRVTGSLLVAISDERHVIEPENLSWPSDPTAILIGRNSKLEILARLEFLK